MTAAQPTQPSDDAVDDLDEAQNELYSTHDKQDGKEGDVPLHDVLRLLAFRPLVILKQVPVHSN